MYDIGDDNQSQITDETHYNLRRQHAVKLIERQWCSFRDKRMFRVLKRSICSAENSVTNEVLKKLSPNEAVMLNDPTIQAKVRFRFGGEEFPPVVMFKVFIRVGSSSTKYMSGKNMIRAESEAAQDALKLMGNRRYYDQLIMDAAQQSKFNITDVMDVSTLRDYMMLQSHEDEMPSYMGGRHNHWRELTLETLSRKDVLYDIIDYINTGRRSDKLRGNYPTLPLNVVPISQPLQYECLKRLSKIKAPGRQSGRHTEQAKRRAAKMRRMYQQEEYSSGAEGNTTYFTKDQSGPSYYPELNITDTVTEDQDWENEASQLYEWSQELSVNDVDYVF